MLKDYNYSPSSDNLSIQFVVIVKVNNYTKDYLQQQQQQEENSPKTMLIKFFDTIFFMSTSPYCKILFLIPIKLLGIKYNSIPIKFFCQYVFCIFLLFYDFFEKKLLLSINFINLISAISNVTNKKGACKSAP